MILICIALDHLKYKVFPNPNNGDFKVKYNLTKSDWVKLSLYPQEGKLIGEKVIDHPSLGENKHQNSLNRKGKAAVYFLTIETPSGRASQKIIFER